MRTAYIGMGANLPSAAGAPDATLAAAVEQLGKLGRVVRRSRLYSTEPVGLAEQPRFTNAAVALETELAPRALLEALLELERAFGRDRSNGVVNGPRTLDLDILLMGGLSLHGADLVIPHPRLAERAFVLAPLAEIAANVVEPNHRKTVAQLLAELPAQREGEKDAVVALESAVWRSGGSNDADAGVVG